MLLLVGWGGVGFASYLADRLLVREEENADAGVKAFVVNTIGDVGLMLGLLPDLRHLRLASTTTPSSAARPRG